MGRSIAKSKHRWYSRAKRKMPHSHKILTPTVNRIGEAHRQTGRRAIMILFRLFLLTQAIALLSRSHVLVSANPLKRLFMMRRMKDGENDPKKRGERRKMPKGDRGGERNSIPDVVSDYLGNDVYAKYSGQQLHSPGTIEKVASEEQESKEANIQRTTNAEADPLSLSSSVEEQETQPKEVLTNNKLADEKDESAVCVHPRQLEQVREQLEEANEGQSKLQRQHELYRQESESRLENLTKANESAFKVARVQEDFADRIIKMQNKVEANLEAAKAAIAAKEEELEAYKKEMKQNEDRLKAEMEHKIAQAKKDWTKQLSEVQTDLNAGNEKIRAEYEGRLKQAEEDKAILKGEKKLLAEQNAELQSKYEKMLRDQEVALKAYLEVNLENEANKKKEIFRDTLIAEIEEIKATSEATISQLSTELATLNSTSIATIQQLQTKYDDLKVTSAKKIEQLSSDYAELQKTSQEKIAEITRNSEKALADLRKQSEDDLKKALASLESSHDAAMSKLSSQISSLQNERQDLVTTIEANSARLKSTEEKYSQAARDAAYWEEKFEKRSYLNLTHITSDASAYATVAAEPVVNSTRSMYDSHVAPVASKSKDMYDHHVRPTIERAASVASPVYKAHVAPHLESAQSTVAQASKSAFDGLKTQYEQACPSAMASLRDMEKTTGILLPDSIIESTRYSCHHADESVSAFLRLAAIVLAILFRRSLWRILVGTTGMLLRLVYRIIVAPWGTADRTKVKKEAPDGGYISGTGGTPPKKPKGWKLL